MKISFVNSHIHACDRNERNGLSVYRPAIVCFSTTHCHWVMAADFIFILLSTGQSIGHFDETNPTTSKAGHDTVKASRPTQTEEGNMMSVYAHPWRIFTKDAQKLTWFSIPFVVTHTAPFLG